MSIVSMVILFQISVECLGTDPRLNTYHVDKQQVSVSGISSGAAMATQLHVIFSRHFMGAGIIAGVPFACSGGTIAGATACMTTPSMESISTFEVLTSSGALFGNVDSPSHMANDKVYIFAGTEDSVVKPGNGPNIARYYQHYIHSSNNIKKVFNIRSEHSMPTMNYGGACNILNKPTYINNCGYDAAFELLNFIYGGHLLKSNRNGSLNGQLLKFDQTEFFHLAPAATYGMDSTGYVYVPAGCMDSLRACKLHVALHGCEMGRAYIDETYVRRSGYNEVGEVNNIIILYPQAVNTVINQHGCWDWFGYTGTFYCTNKGYQIEGIRRILARVMGSW